MPKFLGVVEHGSSPLKRAAPYLALALLAVCVVLSTQLASTTAFRVHPGVERNSGACNTSSLAGLITGLEKQLQEAVITKGDLAELQKKLLEAEKRAEEAKRGEGDAKKREEEANKKEEETRKKEEEARKKAEEAKRGEDGANNRYNDLYAENKRRMYDDSQIFRRWLAANATALQADWKERLAGQPQRGVIMVAGGDWSKTIVNTFATIHMLRYHLNCTLPVAVMYYGPKESINEEVQQTFQKHMSDVEFIDMTKLPYPSYHRPLSFYNVYLGFAAKILALYVAPFQEVLLLDSDSNPVLEPTHLFGLKEYEQHGSLFWPDYWEENHIPLGIMPKRVYEMLHLEHPWGDKSQHRQAEAGQLVLNRGRHWAALEMVLWIITRGHMLYWQAHGDKDLFRIGFALAGSVENYYQVSHYPAISLRQQDSVKGIVQFAPNGSLLFHHRTPAKYNLNEEAPAPTTHITARASFDLAWDTLGGWKLKKEHALMLSQHDCKFSLYDWPAAEHLCAPKYDPNGRGVEQKLPVFEIPAGSFFLAAEAAADAAFYFLKALLKKPA